MQKRTKIVATISDQRCEETFLKSLIKAGVNVIRLNTAHLKIESLPKMVEVIRRTDPKIAILIDTKGPEIRTVAQGQELNVKAGDFLKLVGNVQGETSEGTLYVTYSDITHHIQIGQQILIDDGEIAMVVEENRGDFLVCKILNGGKIKLRKSVNIPNMKIDLPAVSDKDREFIRLAVELNLDFIAHSFVQQASDIQEIKTIMKACGKEIAIIAKIENLTGVENLEEILNIADGIMVARGDLGIEIPEEKIPAIQRRIVKECIKCKKTVIIATQMLHTMITNPRPTRAEISDIATAVSEQADAIMLSGETAMGKYPVEAVQIMTKVAVEMEKEMESLHYRKLLPEENSVLSLLSYSAVTVCLNLPIKAVIVDTLTGRTARYLAAYRGIIPVYAMCYTEEIQRQLAITYGVQTFKIPFRTSKDLFMSETVEKLVEHHLLEGSDQVVVVGGSFGATHGASFIEISKAEDLLNEKQIGNYEK